MTLLWELNAKSDLPVTRSSKSRRLNLLRMDCCSSKNFSNEAEVHKHMRRDDK
jgi:hypothetical protein